MMFCTVFQQTADATYTPPRPIFMDVLHRFSDKPWSASALRFFINADE